VVLILGDGVLVVGEVVFAKCLEFVWPLVSWWSSWWFILKVALQAIKQNSTKRFPFMDIANINKLNIRDKLNLKIEKP
jgi:hypothetical protein